jgi:Phytanoyl-CoA dioxygenase (PhyH)
MSMTILSVDEAESVEFWRSLCPDLTIEGGRPSPRFEIRDMVRLLGQLRFEGYVNMPAIVPDAFVGPLRECVKTLYEESIPLPFAFLYDEFWLAFQGISRFLEGALGRSYRAMPGFWAWYLPPSEDAAGWSPHRDRLQPALDDDNSPHVLTTWLALSDATPINGCIYLLPAHLDDRFQTRVWDGDDNAVVNQPQNIRAVPATAGSILAWNQAVLHWGGRASRLASTPRCSLSWEFQRGDKPPFSTPLLDPSKTPPFRERLGLIGKQFLQYRHMHPMSDDLAAIATHLRDRFMPGSAGT